MPNFKKSPAGGPSSMKMYGKGKNPIMMSNAQRTKLPSKVVDAIDKKEKNPVQMNMAQSLAQKEKFDNSVIGKARASRNEEAKASPKKMYGKHKK